MNQNFELPKKRMPILREMPLEAIVQLMAEGNRSVYNLLKICAQTDPNILLILDDMGMRGAQIFAASIGFCEGWVPKFISCVRARDPDMINFVNQKVPQLTAKSQR